MGSWGHGTFENDEASDWVYDLEEASDFATVEEALESIANTCSVLESPACRTALAAAEVVAATRGRPADALPESVTDWVAEKRKTPEALVVLARRAVAAVKAQSELRESWEESAEHAEWLATIEDLEARLA